MAKLICEAHIPDQAEMKHAMAKLRKAHATWVSFESTIRVELVSNDMGRIREIQKLFQRFDEHYIRVIPD